MSGNEEGMPSGIDLIAQEKIKVEEKVLAGF